MAESQEAKEAQAQQEGEKIEESEFSSLLKKEFKTKTDQLQQAVEGAVGTLAQQALERTRLVEDEPIKTIEAIRAEIDRMLTEQINQVMHHQDFQTIEGAWRGSLRRD